MNKLILLTLLFISTTTFSSERLVPISSLHPTQATIGIKVALEKSKKVEKSYKKGKLSKYLKKKKAPAILGPDSRYWPTDRHHTSYAILFAKIPQNKKQLIVKVIHDWSDLSIEEFQKRMIKNKYVYLKDNSFNEIGFDKLPLYMKDLGDNPLRGLATLARKEGCFEKVSVPFLEFTWAEYFFNSGFSNEEQELRELLKTCHLDDARSLPGYTVSKFK